MIPVGIGNVELRQVPDGPDRSQEKTRTRQAEARGEARQRIPAPADFFAGLERRGERNRERSDRQRSPGELWPGSEDHAMH